MTLSTDVFVHGTGVTHREVYEKVCEFLGIPSPCEIEEGPAAEYRHGDYKIDNAPGQGFNAWVMSDANADGSEITPSHEDDCEPDCDYAPHIVPPWHVHVDMDTAYGYRDKRGGCSTLHGWVIARLIDWLATRGCTLHEGGDGLEQFIGDGAEAQAWFETQALPAIVAEATR